MAVIALQDFSGDSISGLTFAAANGGGDTIACGVKAGGWEMPTILVVRNAGGGAITVTVTMANGTIVGPTNVPATTGHTEIKVSGATVGQIAAVAYSGVTSVTVAGKRHWNTP